MLPSPHGGRLIDRQLTAREVERLDSEFEELPKLRPELDQVYDAAKLGVGAYSPLDGFMDHATLDSVLVTGRLPNSLPWPIPIVLSPPGPENVATIAALRPGEDAAIVEPGGRFIAVLHVREKFPIDKEAIARAIYQTTDPSHPNVAALARTGEVAVSGRIDLLRQPPVPLAQFELTPADARELFHRRGWNRVAGYQTRNVPHTGHEQLQRLSLERDDVDALFIHPVVGPLKAGDYRPEVVVSSYQALIRAYYPQDRVALATLTIAMRYAGPKAALFLAIIRKNFGCSHYIVGRDQAGTNGFYDAYACHRVFDEFPVGIIPLRYREQAYCPRCRGMVSEKSCGHPTDQRVNASQTRVRDAIANRQPLPDEILRPEIVEFLSKPPAILNGTEAQARPGGRPARDAPRGVLLRSTTLPLVSGLD